MVGPPSAWTDARGAGAGETDEGRKSGAAPPTAGPEGKHQRDKEAGARRDVTGRVQATRAAAAAAGGRATY